MDTLELVSITIGILLGLGALLAAFLRFWSLPGRVEKLESALASSQDERDREISGVLDQLEQDRKSLQDQLNNVLNQVSDNKLEAATAIASAREIQNGIRERLQVFERVEAAVSGALLANAEKKAEIERLKTDYQQLNETVQTLNREVGALKAICHKQHRG